MIRLLEQDANLRGDLFSRLMGDLFMALGYERPRQNIHKSGREIDLEAIHRIEKRRVIAECKATLALVGGSDINKFVGVLDAERRVRRRYPVVGYFISLSGFTETALQQEADLTTQRVVLLSGVQIVNELVRGRILVPLERALERAGRCAASHPAINPQPEVWELLGHKMGWIWLIKFATGQVFTHYALIHADGEALAPELAAQVVAADERVGGTLSAMNYLPPSDTPESNEDRRRLAAENYSQYLINECGDIQLEGLPADQDTGSRRFNLESLFVPLHIVPLTNAGSDRNPLLAIEQEYAWQQSRISVGEVLADQPRIAILGPPGAGKSTLLRRLAVAYAAPVRRHQANDDLPDRTWLPLLIRCRQLGDRARRPITEVLDAIPAWAEMNHLAEDFR